MAFDDVQFPTGISWGAQGGPSYSTDIVRVDSGYEARNQNWSQALCEYDVSHAIKTASDMATLLAFFRARKGRARGFRFKDWGDYTATAQATSPATGDGATVAFQLQKAYTSGGVTEYRTITKPVTGTISVYKNGVLFAPGYTVDYATGIITFSVAPANGVAITATFEFDVPCRFDIDKMKYQVVNPNVFSWEPIPIVETRDIA